MRVSDLVTVPCGHCLGCRTDQARGWAVRMVHESHVLPPAWMVTLTYRPEEMPEYGSLRPADITRFLKRLRKSAAGRLSYFVAGEYGEKTARPHYHAVLFGVDFLDRDRIAVRHDAPVFRSEHLEGLWSHGLCEFTGLNYAAARYVAAYVRKKVRQREDPDHYSRVVPESGELVELAVEYARMSRRPAIGRVWIERYWRDVYPRDVVVMDGQELKPPRYYDKWMDAHHPDVMEAVRRKRYEEVEEISAEQLAAKEKVHHARVNLFQSRGDV